MFEKLCLEALFICCCATVHRTDGFLDIPVREKVAGRGRGGDLDLGLARNIIELGCVTEHGGRVEVRRKRGAPGEDGTPEFLGGMSKKR